MISFRYHLVTIVAVFLAIALGVLMGTTVVNQGVIDDLTRRTDAAVERADELRKEVGELSAQTDVWERFGAAVEPLLTRDELDGREIVLVTLEGVDVAEVDGVRRILETSGGAVVGVLVATPQLGLQDEDLQEELAILLSSSASKSPEELGGEAAERLGARLALGPGGADQDFLEQLVSAGFMAVRGANGTISSIGGPEQGIVLISGGQTEPAVLPEQFLSPLAASLVEFSRPVVAAETAETVYPFVPLVRDDGRLDGGISTVDNADTMPGRIALVLALRNLFVLPGSGGDFGVKDGAAGLLPSP
jgi:hypothetical protein